MSHWKSTYLGWTCVSVCDCFRHLMWANWAHCGQHYHPLEPQQVVFNCVRVDKWSWAQTSKWACTHLLYLCYWLWLWCNTLSETPAFVWTPSQPWWTRTGNCELKETISLLSYFLLDYFIMVTERKWNTSCSKVLSGLKSIYNNIYTASYEKQCMPYIALREAYERPSQPVTIVSGLDLD